MGTGQRLGFLRELAARSRPAFNIVGWFDMAIVPAHPVLARVAVSAQDIAFAVMAAATGLAHVGLRADSNGFLAGHWAPSTSGIFDTATNPMAMASLKLATPCERAHASRLAAASAYRALSAIWVCRSLRSARSGNTGGGSDGPRMREPSMQILRMSAIVGRLLSALRHS